MDEQLQYPVHGSQVRYAVASMRAQGIPFDVQPGAGGIYIIVIPAGYAPMVHSQPWAQPPRAASVLRNFPFAQVAATVLILVGAYFAFQAAPLLLAGLAGDAAVVVEKGSEGEGESGSNPLQVALHSVLAIPDKVSGEIDRRVNEAKQEIQEAMFSAAMMACGVPLLVVFGGLAALMVLRMAMRGRR